ncbi:MAG: class II aldolase/adducin family protein [Chloroflexi bacterium]|nr:class II aldolase/adducin family protein [Chloroflexota bacterium]
MANGSVTQATGQWMATRKSSLSTKEQWAPQIMMALDSLVRSSLLSTSTGEISTRVSTTDTVLMTPSVPFVEKITANDLLELTIEGRILGKRGHPSLAQQMHLAIYRARADVRAIVHCKAPMTTVLGICQLPIPPITMEAIPFTDLPRIPAYPLLKQQWLREVAAKLTDGIPAALLLHEGMVTIGLDLQQAVRRAIALENTARILVICHLLHQVPSALPPEAVDVLRNTPFIG